LSILRTLTRNIEKIAGKNTWAGGGLARLGLPPQGQLRCNPHYAGQEGGASQGGENSHAINLSEKGTWDRESKLPNACR
jgi:hypothetical protein